MNRIEILQKIIDKSGAKIYLEIGVGKFECFNEMKVKTKIAVDPILNVLSSQVREYHAKKSIYLIPHTSNYFFEHYKLDEGLDLVFVDGLHTYQQSLMDINNSLRNLNEKGVIVVHDCLPTNAAAAYPATSYSHVSSLNLNGWTGEWCGDVWKSICYLRSTRKDLNIFVLDTDYGLGIITRGINNNRLDLTADVIDKLTYNDFEKNKGKFLNLKQVDFFINFLESFQ
jgi:hypothetical protein